MAKILKDIYVSWTWEGDEMLLEGFNVAIAPQGSDPKTEAIIIQKTSSEKTDILNRGTTQYEHIFRNITLNKDTNYIAWVQSLTEGFDSEWLSATGINVSDDGKATIATTDADGNPITSSGGDVTIDSAGITVVNGAFKLVNSSGSITIDNTGITANDGSKDTFKIDSNGNASFSGNLNAASGSFSDGNVDISSSGITISSGGLTVTNPDGDVIIDGESDMFKIHQTGTVSVSAGGSISVHHGLGYAPAFLFFIDFQGSRNFPIYNYLGFDIGYYGVRAETNSTSVVFSAEYINTNIKYFILKEEAF